MADNKDTKYIPKSRFKLATQEDCNRINNGGATQIVSNRRTRKSETINPIDYSDDTTNDTKD